MNNSSNSWAFTISQAQSQERWHVTPLHPHSNLLRTTLLIISIMQWKKLGFGEAEWLSRPLRGGDPAVSLNIGSLCLGTLGLSLFLYCCCTPANPSNFYLFYLFIISGNDYPLCSLVVLHSILREEFSWHCSELAEEYLSRELMRYLEGQTTEPGLCSGDLWNIHLLKTLTVLSRCPKITRP